MPGTLAANGTVLLDPSPSTSLVHHEIFHQVQYQYIGWTRLTDDAVQWWLEATAEWGTHQLDRLEATPTVGYARKLDHFLATPADRLESTSDHPLGREYGAFILAEYLERQGGSAQTIIRTWDTIGSGATGQAPIDAVHDELVGVRSLTDFWVWSYVLSRDPARDVGFDDIDVPAWRVFLQTNPATSASTVDAARPARADTHTLLPGAIASGDLGVAPGGAAYVDLNFAATGNHHLTINVATHSRVDSDLRVAAMPFSDYPDLCGPVTTGQPVNGIVELEVFAGAGCTSVTLAFVNEARPQIFGRANAKFNWEVATEIREGNATIYLAGVPQFSSDEKGFVASVLSAAGYQVESGWTIPPNLAGIGQLWWLDRFNVPPVEDIPRLEEFVNNGGGLYLTGERTCCETLNQWVEEVVNRLVLNGPVQVGGLGDPFHELGTLDLNPAALGGITTTPHHVSEIRVDSPGGMAGITGENVLAATPGGVPIAAIWDAEHLTGDGRLTVVMDFNWLESRVRGPLADELVENIALYLSHLPEAPVPPPVLASVPATETSPASEGSAPPHTGSSSVD